MAKVKFKQRGFTDHIVIHCSATKPLQDIGLREIRMWHKVDNGWLDVGYHFIIRRDGTVEEGRPMDVVGAHVANNNSNSVSVCLVGGLNEFGDPHVNYTTEQWDSLTEVVKMLQMSYPDATVKGHRDFDPKKACPCFDAQSWWNAVE